MIFLPRPVRITPQRALLALVLAGQTCAAEAALPIERIEMPPGFHIEVLTDAVPEAREMALGGLHDGHTVVYVGSTAGNVYAVELDGGRSVAVHRIASGLNDPLGVAYHDGALYVSAVSRIVRFAGIDARLDDPPPAALVTDKLPTETHHGGRFLAFGPDGWLYVPVGAPCNVCERDQDHYENIQRMHPDGSAVEVVARGVRNSVGFDWDPVDKTLWFTDNGRDLMGDDIPSDKLNHAPRFGMNFGFPYCHAGDIADPDLGAKHACSEFTPPAAKLGAHVATLGMRFYRGQAFPAEFRHAIFVAEHGSWNRSRKIGYRIAAVWVDAQGRVTRQAIFAEGWLQVDPDGREHVWGRPVDVLELPDGSLLVSDDFAGAIYRISYRAG